jgi:isopenicillin-N N-acyltransferase like protein
VGFASRHRKKLAAAAALITLPIGLHVAIGVGTRIHPPAIERAAGEPVRDAADADLTTLGRAYARHRGRVLEVRLEGTPEAIGHQHGRLLYGAMVENEGKLLADFRRFVPVAPARWLIMDLSRLKFRRVDLGMPEAFRREIAAQAGAFTPDPYEAFLPTYHRFVFLQSLYDIALSFEHSPLIGCTSFALTGGAFEGGGVVLARNFDFEAGPVFDEGKAVFLVRETGRIPYASVAWPGLVGVVTGMNAEGVAVAVHGGRAREPRSTGEPVVHSMRDVLGRSRTTNDAVELLAGKQAMVSHLLIIADPSGDVAIVERAPGEPQTVRRGSGKVPLTNHFEGPLASDPRNQSVLASTSTRARRARLDELLAGLPAGADVERVASVLRDRRAAGGAELPLGDRRSIDALIATHGVVMDATKRVIWVSEGPHLLGRFLRFDVGALLAAGFEPRRDDAVRALPADPLASDPAYRTWLERGSPRSAEDGRAR